MRMEAHIHGTVLLRAGTTTAYSFGNDPSELGKYAWFFDNSNETTHEVGQKQPNPWGLYDMYGNASEWVLDQYLPEGYKKFGGRPTNWKDAIVWPTKLFPRVLRGGSWDADAADCRSAARRPSNDQEWREIDPNSPKSPWWFTEPEALGVGFRVIRPLKPAPAAERSKYWDADLASITDDAKDRVDQGRGARGIVDRDLPAAIKALEIEREAPIDHLRQGKSLYEVAVGVIDSLVHGGGEAGREFQGEEFVHRIVVASEEIERQVDAVLLQVDGHVLPEVG